METKPIYLKSKKTILMIGIASSILISASGLIFYQVGHNQASVVLHNEKQTINTIDKEIESTNKEYDEIWNNVSRLKGELKTIQSEYDQAKSIVSQKDELTKNVQDLQASIDAKNKEISTLDAQINTKKQELEVLTKGIAEKQEQPRTMIAGNFIGGKDIPAGRYKVVPAGRSGNYVVYSSTDRLKVNIVLGSDARFDLAEYVFQLNDGDKIEATLPVKYIPVQ